MASAWNAPPGQTTTAVPVARDGSGRKAVSVGCVTLRTFLKLIGGGENDSFSCWVQSSVPGAPLGQTRMTSGWSGLFMGYSFNVRLLLSFTLRTPAPELSQAGLEG